MHLPLEKSPEQQQNSVSRAKARVLFAFLGLAFVAGVLFPSHGARAAISFVQVNAGQCSSSCTASTIPFTSNNTAGNLIIVGIEWDSSAVVNSVTDTLGTVYWGVGSAKQGSGPSASHRAQIWYAKNIKGGAQIKSPSPCLLPRRANSWCNPGCDARGTLRRRPAGCYRGGARGSGSTMPLPGRCFTTRMHRLTKLGFDDNAGEQSIFFYF
jgi:hypothetical protein